MKVKHHTDNKLILERKPVITFILLGIFVFVILFIFLSSPNEICFTCKRLTPEQGFCKLTKKSFTSTIETFKIPAKELIIAIPVTKSIQDEEYESYILLSTTTGFKRIYDFKNKSPGNISDRINIFIKNEYKKELTIKQNNTTLNIIYLIIFIVIAFSFSTLIDFVYCIFDKKNGKITLIRKNILGEKTRYFELSTVKDIEIEVCHLFKGSKSIKQYRIILKLASDKEIPLMNHYALNSSRIKKAAQILTEFLGLKKEQSESSNQHQK